MFHRNERTGQCNPSRKAIIEFTAMDKSHVSRSVAGLESKGWVVETPDGFVFPSDEVAHSATSSDGDEDPVVAHSATYGIGNVLPIRQPKVAHLDENVAHLATSLNNDFKQRKQRIEQLSIDAMADGYEKKFPGNDRKVVEVGILYTMLQRQDPRERISSFAYFSPEIEKVIKAGNKGQSLDMLLRRRREQFEVKINDANTNATA